MKYKLLVGLFALLCCGNAVLMLLLEPRLRQVLADKAPRSYVFLAGGVAVTLLGALDDVYGLRARNKLLAEIAIAFALCASGFTVGAVALPTGTVILYAACAALAVAGLVITFGTPWWPRSSGRRWPPAPSGLSRVERGGGQPHRAGARRLGIRAVRRLSPEAYR